jgi:protein TonB
MRNAHYLRGTPTTVALNMAIIGAFVLSAHEVPVRDEHPAPTVTIVQIAHTEPPALEPAPPSKTDPVSDDLAGFADTLPDIPWFDPLPAATDLFPDLAKRPTPATNFVLAVDWPDDAPITAGATLASAPAPLQRQSPTTVASSGTDTTASALYWSEVRNRIARELRYPDPARRRGIEGIAVYRVSVDTNGNLVAIAELTLTVDAALRHAAANAIRRAAPFTPFAMDGAASIAMTADIPVSFKLLE